MNVKTELFDLKLPPPVPLDLWIVVAYYRGGGTSAWSVPSSLARNYASKDEAERAALKLGAGWSHATAVHIVGEPVTAKGER